MYNRLSITILLKSRQGIMDYRIRDVEVEDFEQIQDIYAHYVTDTTFSFEEEPPSVGELESRWTNVRSHRLPYIVAKTEDAEVLGFAYAMPYRARPAYRYTVEHSVYVSPHHRGFGIGSDLLETMIDRLTVLKYRQLIAVIGGGHNSASLNLHLRCGFQSVAVLKSVGFKFNQWVDSIIMQRPLGEGDGTLP